jgi:hypothetical protein
MSVVRREGNLGSLAGVEGGVAGTTYGKDSCLLGQTGDEKQLPDSDARNVL